MPTPTSSGTVSTFTPSGTNDLDAILNGDKTKWGDAGTPHAATVTYSFPGIGAAWMSGYGNEVTSANFAPLSTAQMTAVRSALATWSAVANISFSEVAESSTSVGDIRFGLSYAVGDEAWGYAYYPGNAAYAGDIWINRKDVADKTFTPGDFDFSATIHEMGHAIGLKHPGNYNAGGGGAEGPYIMPSLDRTTFTIMSYTDPEWGGIYVQTPGVYDIQAIQYLYGANTTTNTGNTTYTFSPSNLVGKSIWDASGTDTIDANAFTSAVTIDLQDGHYSNIGLTENLGIAFGTTIENAKGGTASDTLIGNTASNTFTGGAGSDKFLFSSALNASSNVDHITDFTPGADKIYLSNSVFSAYAKVGADLTQDFILGTAAVDATDHFLYDTSTGSLYYDQDGTGSTAAVKFAILDGGAVLSASDLYTFGSGADSGNTTQIYDGSTEEGTDTKDDLDGSDGNDDMSGGTGNDTLTGGEGDDYIDGGEDNDNLNGGDGIDYLTGGGGTDKLDGGDGDDEMYGDAGNDTIIGGGGDDYAEGDDDNDSLSGGAGDDLLGGGDGADKLDGGTGDDEMYGDAGNDQLIGGAGNDDLDGGEGDDKMAGGAGDDFYYVDSRKDTITEKTGEGTDAVVSNIDYTLAKEVEWLFLYGDEGLTGTGNKSDNYIVGGDNDDTLYGKEGNDELDGGLGSDIFVFDTKLNASTNVDTIDDFMSGEDMIYLRKNIFAGVAVGEVTDANFIFYSSATEDIAEANAAGERFIYDQDTGDLYFDKDGSGAGEAIKFATLDGQPDLAASDLFVF